MSPLFDDEGIPTGRWGDLDALPGATIVLASAVSSLVNGYRMHVDGGITTSF